MNLTGKIAAAGIAFSVGAAQIRAHDWKYSSAMFNFPIASVTFATSAAASQGITVINPITDEVIHWPLIQQDTTAKSA